MADDLRRDRSLVMAAGVLLEYSRAKVRAGVLPDHSRVMAAAVALRAKQAAVDALQDHHPVKAAQGVMGAATVAEDKAVAAVRTISSRAAVSLNWSPASGNGASLRQRQRAGDGRNIACFTSPVPTPPALKNHLPDQVPASVGA